MSLKCGNTVKTNEILEESFRRISLREAPAAKGKNMPY